MNHVMLRRNHTMLHMINVTLRVNYTMLIMIHVILIRVNITLLIKNVILFRVFWPSLYTGGGGKRLSCLYLSLFGSIGSILIS